MSYNLVFFLSFVFPFRVLIGLLSFQTHLLFYASLNYPQLRSTPFSGLRFMLFWENPKDDALALCDFSNHDFLIGGFMQSALYLKLHFKCADKHQTKEMREFHFS